MWKRTAGSLGIASYPTIRPQLTNLTRPEVAPKIKHIIVKPSNQVVLLLLDTSIRTKTMHYDDGDMPVCVQSETAYRRIFPKLNQNPKISFGSEWWGGGWGQRRGRWYDGRISSMKYSGTGSFIRIRFWNKFGETPLVRRLCCTINYRPLSSGYSYRYPFYYRYVCERCRHICLGSANPKDMFQDRSLSITNNYARWMDGRTSQHFIAKPIPERCTCSSDRVECN